MSNLPQISGAGSAASTITIGRTDVRTTPMGIGTWAWGDRIVWGYRGKDSDEDLRAAFQATLDAGITLLDTAELYGFGRSETLIGEFMRATGQHPTIATKFMPLPWRLGKGSLLSALRASLRRLGMKQVDLYQIHWPAPPVSIETWMDGLADAVQAGLVRAVGVSNYNVDQTRRAHAALAKRGVPLASNQVEYSLIERDPERSGLLKLCTDLGIALIAYSPLGMGLLSGKYTPDNPPKGMRARWYNALYLTALQPLTALLRDTGQAHGGKTPSQVALNWTICKGTLPIPGAKNIRQVQDNAGALAFRLTETEVAALDAAAERLYTETSKG